VALLPNVKELADWLFSFDRLRCNQGVSSLGYFASLCGHVVASINEQVVFGISVGVIDVFCVV
jgi:hypothetical protein